MNNDARGLLIQAEQARERGDFKRSLELLATAIVTIQEEQKEANMVDALSSQALAYRHLFNKTGSRQFIILAMYAALAAVKLAEDLNDPTPLAIAYYNLGKTQESMNLLDEALASYKEAVGRKVDRPAMVSEMRTRLAVLEYKMGDKKAMDRFETALAELKNSGDRDNYAKSVWISGAYMHMSEALIGKENDKAIGLLDEAKKVINTDMRLKLRKIQLEKLTFSLSQN